MPAVSGFGLDNLPYGVDENGHVVVAWEDGIVDLSTIDDLDRLGVDPAVFRSGSLAGLFALGPDGWERTRAALSRLLPSASPQPRSSVNLVLPWAVGDYTDFYASRSHVEAMGRMLRPGEDPLPPAWLHLPVAYHGRAGTVIVSGEPVYRPSGMVAPGRFGPTERLDVEVELGFVVGTTVPRGRILSASEAEAHIFGVVILNDWSARDIQAFEYRPLGPFLGKSFATSVSPWVVPLAALEPWRVDGPVQDPAPADYLKVSEPRGFDVQLRLFVNGDAISSMSSAGLYWSPAQMLAHLTANGAGVRAGDLFATGTISGRTPGSEGSLMEHFGGQRWLADGDVVSIEAWCGGPAPGDHGWVSLGSVTGEVVGR